ncbi:MAG: type II toxin-antitoxin system HicB family antitoxin [bacterium]
MHTLTIVLESNYPEEGYTVRVPALPGCVTYGRNKEETIERAEDGIEGFVEKDYKKQVSLFQRIVVA